jgi:DNA-binding NarL/FixJ family response regulator
MKRKIRILLADDQSLFREGLKTLLNTNDQFEICGEASNGEEAVKLAIIEKPDVILMDIRMPALNGIDATRRLRAAVSDEDSCRVIILTTFDTDEDVFEALRAGASGYLLKDVSTEKLFEAIEITSRGESFLQPMIASKVLAEFTRMPRMQATTADQELIVPLSRREKEILQLIATGASNKEIAETLMIAEGTVKNHVSSILSKLEARDRMQAVILAQRIGLI